MSQTAAVTHAERPAVVTEIAPATRLYYLDWLRVIAVFGVFLFHAVHPFDMTPWHIKNAELSTAVTLFIVLMFPWGMPFFFLISGAGSWFALRRRTAGEFARERFYRLLLPYFVGALLLMPVMLFFEWRHKTSTGLLSGPFVDYLLNRHLDFSPKIFGSLGYHLWFLGFLFAFSILGLPLFLWLKGEAGRRFTDRLAGLCLHRGAILLFAVPLVVLRLVLHTYFPLEHGWADFAVLMTFFLYGFILFSDDRFRTAIARDRLILLVVGLAIFAAGLAIAVYTGDLDVYTVPRTPLDYLFWTLITTAGWCWSLFVLDIGRRYLDFRNRYLEYGMNAIMPFFVFHQPVIIMVAYFVVQWPISLVLKLIVVVVSSFLLTLGIYEFVIRRNAWLSRLFGMKAITSESRQAG